MDFMKWMIGGLVGAAIGGIVWVLVGYYLEAEVGYIAWGIGLLAGIGVRATAGQNEGAMCGIAGVLAAVIVILGAKYIVVSMAVDDVMAGEEMSVDVTVTAEDMIVEQADGVVAEFEEEGKPVNWPEGMTVEEATAEADYPADIWAEAKQRYEEIPEDVRQQQIREREEQIKQAMEQFGDMVKEAAFQESFNAMDLLWFGLAAFTAWRVGCGGDDDGDDE